MPDAIKYPSIKRDDSHKDSYHGNEISDPYIWLEDPDSDETKKFVESQNLITQEYLDNCEVKDKFYKRLKDLWNYPKYGCPFKRGSRYFYFHNSGLQNQSVLYVQESWGAEPEVFLDPNKLAADGTISIKAYSFSEDSTLFAYMLSKNGSDWCTVKFMNVATRKDLQEVLENVKFSCLEWTHDNKGVFYNMYPKAEGKQDGTETLTNLNQKLYYHCIGTEQSNDVLCVDFPENPKWMIGAEMTDDGRYVLITVRNGCDPVNKLFYVDLEKINYRISDRFEYVKIVDNFDASYEFIANNGSVMTFITNLKAPRYKVINIDFERPEMENWTTLIDEHSKDVMEWTKCVNNHTLVVCYLHDVKNQLFLHNLADGKRFRQLPLDVGTVTGCSGRRKDTEIFYKFTSFLTPGTIYHYNMIEKTPSEPKIFRQSEVVGFDPAQYQTEQMFVESKDGTKIPLFIVHKKNIVLDGTHPCLLYGYGGFSISITPSFSPSRIVMMQHLGGIFAVANIRGGGEYGEEWHKAGTHAQKQNVFDDFQAAAQSLIDKKYTSNEKLAIQGGSNGGLLVAACANQRPDLFKCVICQVGVLDMLKFHKFTIGHAWTTDFGCSENKEDFEFLLKYSPLHNIKISEENSATQYPAMLLLTADHDDRVVPLHSFKFIAELQHAIGSLDAQTNPLLIRIDTKAGHGAGKPTNMIIEEASDIYAFLARNVEAKWND